MALFSWSTAKTYFEKCALTVRQKTRTDKQAAIQTRSSQYFTYLLIIPKQAPKYRLAYRYSTTIRPDDTFYGILHAEKIACLVRLSNLSLVFVCFSFPLCLVIIAACVGSFDKMCAYVNSVYTAQGVESWQHRRFRWSVHWARSYLLSDAGL